LNRVTVEITGYFKNWALRQWETYFSLFLLFSVLAALLFVPAASASARHQTLGELNIGDRVTDSTWAWEYRLGHGYSDSQYGVVTPPGIYRPVTWIVVARDHYGPGSGITLLAQDLIGLYPFDDGFNPTESGFNMGYNHWGDSGSRHDATAGLRPWLNSQGQYSTEGFFQAFSDRFKSRIISASIPNRNMLDGSFYYTTDYLFIPSATELGIPRGQKYFDDPPYDIGKVYPYFIDSDHFKWQAELPGFKDTPQGLPGAGDYYFSWTRSPGGGPGLVSAAGPGSSNFSYASDGSLGVRPALNLCPLTPVSLQPSPQSGAYEILDLSGRIYPVAYIPVMFPGADCPQPLRSISELKTMAGFVSHFFRHQSFGEVIIEADFISHKWLVLDKTLAEYRQEAQRFWNENRQDPFFSAWDQLDFFTDWLIVRDAMDMVRDYRPGLLDHWDYLREELEPIYYKNVVVIQAGQNTSYRGVSFSRVNLNAVNDRTSYATWAHELGHGLFDFRDYYGEGRNFGDIIYFGLMGRGTNINPPAPFISYNRYLAGWMDIKEFFPGDTVTVPLLETLNFGDPLLFVKPPSGDVHYFIVEGRSPPDGVIYTDPWFKADPLWQVSRDQGILIYQVQQHGGELYFYTIPNVDFGLIDRGYTAFDFIPPSAKKVTLTPGQTYTDDYAGLIFSLPKGEPPFKLKVDENPVADRKIIRLTLPSFNLLDSRGSSLGTYTAALSPCWPLMENDFAVNLKLIDEQGNMVGIDYEQGEYLIDIPGARTSGRLASGGPQWISVPAGVEVQYELDTLQAEMWLQELVQSGWRSEGKQPETIAITALVHDINVDHTGNRDETLAEVILTVSADHLQETDDPLQSIFPFDPVLLIIVLAIILLTTILIIAIRTSRKS